MLIICILIWNVVAKPLSRLANDAEHDITPSLSIKELTARSDEIGRLAKSLQQRDDRVQGLVETLEDKVDERTAELASATRLAESANDAKTAFLATMSHEIRTPMNGVVGMAEALGRTELSQEQRDYLAVMQSSGGALLALIDDILDISKIEAGKLTLEPMPVHPAEVVDEVCGLYRAAADRKDIELISETEQLSSEPIVTDQLRLRQIISNLVSNAIKFTEQGFVRVEARALRDGRLQVVVEDTGPGIPAKMQATIFNKFEQAETSTTRRFGGTGLGLAISRELSHLLGGSLELQSEEGRGARFILTIASQGEAQVREPVFKTPAANSDDADKAVAGMRILVAEDLAVNQQVLAAICRPLDVTLVMADNGREAIEFLKEERFDAVLMDLRMPVMDGLEAMRRIRAGEAGEDAKGLPIIALTANAMREHVEESLAAGADAHVAKPVSRRALTAALAAHCGLSTPAEERIAY
nr:ATP-binding protein [Parvularcula mediterranea]